MPTTWPEPLPDGKYLLLTTFGKDGRPVATPVWFTPEPVTGRPPLLLAYSGTDTGKVKRLRHTPRVLVGGCNFRGRPNGLQVEAHTQLVEGEAAWKQREQVGRRYGLTFRLWKLYFSRFRRGEYQHPVGIRISPPAE